MATILDLILKCSLFRLNDKHLLDVLVAEENLEQWLK